MYYLETTKAEYEIISQRLLELRPNLKITVLSCDENLERLGFCRSAPCLISFDLDSKECKLLMDELMHMEIDAYYPEPVLENTPAYKRYRRYGFLWDVLNSTTESI